MRNNRKQTLLKHLAVILLAIFVSLAAGAQQSAGSSKTSGKAQSSSPTAATAGNPSAPASPPKVVLKVGGTQITQSELESVVPMRASGASLKLSPQGRRKVADGLVKMFVLSRQAVNDHLDASPELRFKLELQRMETLERAELEKMRNQIQVTPDEIHKYYTDHTVEFDTVLIREFLVRKRKAGGEPGSGGLSAEEAKAKAESIREQLAAGDSADKIAEDFSGADVLLIDPKPRTFRRDQMIPELGKATFEAKEGTVPEAVDTPDAVIVVDLLRHQAVQEKDAAPDIEKKVRQLKLDAQIDELKKKIEVWMDDNYFKDAPGSAPVSTAQPPASDPK